jgi:hypothetical protein
VKKNKLVMCSTLSLLLVLLNTVVGKAGKDELGGTWEICKIDIKFWSESSHFDYPDTNGGMIETFFKYSGIKKNSNTTI